MGIQYLNIVILPKFKWKLIWNILMLKIYFFMKLIYFRNSNHDIGSILNEALPYCQQIENPTEILIFAITNMYTEWLIPKLFNENFLSNTYIYEQSYLLFNGKMLNKNIIIYQIAYFIQKKFHQRIDRPIEK